MVGRKLVWLFWYPIFVAWLIESTGPCWLVKLLLTSVEKQGLFWNVSRAHQLFSISRYLRNTDGCACLLRTIWKELFLLSLYSQLASLSFCSPVLAAVSQSQIHLLDRLKKSNIQSRGCLDRTVVNITTKCFDAVKYLALQMWHSDEAEYVCLLSLFFFFFGLSCRLTLKIHF